MTYQEQIKMVVAFLYNETKCFATSRTYHIPYAKIVNGYNTQVADEKIQDDIREEWCNSQYTDKIQALDFDNAKEEIIVMIWETNKKTIYTLKDYEKFCKDALIMPPFEDDKQIEEWFKTHKIHITANNCTLELEYDADAVNEIEFALREIHEAILGDGTATIGNTVGSEYRDATWKDILRLNIMRLVYDGKTMEWAIKYTINDFDSGSYKKCMGTIYNHTWYNDEFEVNFFKLSSCDMGKLFDAKERKQAIKEMICTKLDIFETISKDGRHCDQTIIFDYSIHPAGHLVAWHYGVDLDENSEDNQCYIQNYIKEMMGE